MARLRDNVELPEPGSVESTALLAVVSADQRWRPPRRVKGVRLLLLEQLLSANKYVPVCSFEPSTARALPFQVHNRGIANRSLFCFVCVCGVAGSRAIVDVGDGDFDR